MVSNGAMTHGETHPGRFVDMWQFFFFFGSNVQVEGGQKKPTKKQLQESAEDFFWQF